MPVPRRRRRITAVLLAALVVDAGVALVTHLPAGATTASAVTQGAVQDDSTPDGKKGRPFATLEIIEPGASVRAEGEDEFVPAKDGQQLRVGDTVKTDDTGFVAIHYTEDDESFTRLDVNTEFTIVSLTDDEGNRKVEGSLDVGRTWNRTTALTESESFDQEGAGATAAVDGTAFMVVCTGPGTCLFISVVDNLVIRTVDGEIISMQPLQQCDATKVDATDTNLCGTPEGVDVAALLADAWIAQNIYIDGLAGHPGPVVGTVEVQGTSVTFTPAGGGAGGTSSTPSSSTPPVDLPPPPPPPPDEETVTDPVNEISPSPGNKAAIETPDCQTSLSLAQGCDTPYMVQFTLNVPVGATYIQFTDEPHQQTGNIFAGATPDFGNCATACVNLGTQYNVNETFWFVPEDVSETTQDSFSFVSGNDGGVSEATEVPITVTDSDAVVVDEAPPASTSEAPAPGNTPVP